ncbi:MAG: hypothetical protein KDE58_11330 [Caldilineaceae bacterium]|nr:hypothetical protein [Caldilineaceae bacterium]
MIMLTNVVVAIRKIRMDLEEDAGENFPTDVSRELLVLYDILKALEFNIFIIEDALGEIGYRFVTTYTSTPLAIRVNP